ncbi:cytochrome P450 [Aspergillus bertholletiae]|uniref:Cytochrome P450 n=1 Tax=Aspergillus bertholletiae TaxID=1226010 RepID=A0A5N7AUM5_9EURO|nr:cytochrome P450 [Aspergillus bertholletiae]
MFLLIVVLLSYILGKACYRLFFHPLHAFPGPKLAAITSLYEFYYAIVKDGQFIWEVGRLHDKYGPIVRITPHELHIRDLSFYNEIYANGSRVRDKSSSFVRFFGVPDSLVATVDHNHHRQRRKILNKYFSRRAVLEVQPLIQAKVDALMQHFSRAYREQSVINLSIAFSALIGDIISNYAYSQDYGFLEDIEHLNEIKTATQALGSCEKVFPQAARVIKVQERLGEQANVAMSAKRTMPLPNTVFTSLIDQRLPSEERTLDRLQDEGYILLGAGIESVTWTLSVTMFYLLGNKKFLYRLHEELGLVMPQPNHVPSLSKLKALPLLRATIREGLRLSIGILSRLPRVAPFEALNYNGYIIPPGTPVSQSAYSVHMDPQHFPDPHTFNPERWLGTAEEIRALESMLVPFSRGSRQCLGMNLAYAKLFLSAATLVRRYDLELVDTTLDNVEPYRDHFLVVPKNGHRGIKAIITQEYT